MTDEYNIQYQNSIDIVNDIIDDIVNHSINNIDNITIKNNKLCIIRCYTGSKPTKILKAVDNYDCYFFTNNSYYKEEIINKGWKYIFLDNLPLTDNKYISSLQSKYIKFLQFLRLPQFKFFFNYELILYVDHKFLINLEHIDKFLSIYDEVNSKFNKQYIIRFCPIFNNLSKNLYHELEFSKNQNRYLIKYNITKKFVEKKIKNGSVNPYLRVCNTGLILCNHHNDDIFNFSTKVYLSIIKFQNPQCQIFWQLFSQNYDNLIHKINYNHIFIPRYSI